MRLLKGLLFAVLLLCLVCAAGAETAPQSFILTGTLVKGETEVRMYLETPGSGPRVSFPKKEVCEILGETDKYYYVSWKDQTGYIAKAKLELGGVDSGEYLTEVVTDSLMIDDLTPKKKDTKYLSWEGALISPWELDAVEGFLWDERQLKVEKAFLYVPNGPSDTIGASVFEKLIPLDSVTAGRKTLVLQGIAGEDRLVLFRTQLALRGKYQEEAHITALCKVSNARVTDSELKTAWAPTKEKPLLTVEIPADAGAALMTLEWKKIPSSFTVTLSGEDGELSKDEYATGFFADSVPLSSDVRRVTITFPAGGELATLRVYPEEYADTVQRWEPTPEKAELMVISTHQDDEFLFFGGTIPCYCAQGRDVAVVYMTNCGRDRYREALDGLWSAGLRAHPVFLGWIDKDVAGMNVAMGLWERSEPEPVLGVVRLLRQYKPEVVVTHDFAGEYGHMQHQLTAKLVSEAAALAADENADPASAVQWGTWQVKKLYIHLYPENRIEMDWEEPIDWDTAVTPMFLAKEGFDRHRSQQGYFQMETTGVIYDNHVFGLYSTTVGPDVEKNDFFENIP